MKFCPECGTALAPGVKFCPECGFDIAGLARRGAGGGREPAPAADGPAPDAPAPDAGAQRSSRDLGASLEDTVEQILKETGFSTETRAKKRGSSGQLNEIDIVATKDGGTLAVECKNYDESRSVGIKEMRDFTAKMEDLGMESGLFVTSSSFSRDAAGWAASRPGGRAVELWDNDTLMEKFRSAVLGKSGGQTVRIEGSLSPRDGIDSYFELLLKNRDNVAVSRGEMEFHPYYTVQFTLRDQFRTPDKQIHTLHSSGTYVADGMTGDVLYSTDGKDERVLAEGDEKEQIVQDLMHTEPHKTVEVARSQRLAVSVRKPSMGKRDIEFSVKRRIVEDNRAEIPYTVKRSRGEEEKRDYTHVPGHGSVQVQSKLIYVPVLDIEFSSKEHTYRRRVLVASGTTMVDDIAVCKHTLRKKHTFAVCETCGVAKCEDDITVSPEDLCYCREHAPADPGGQKKSRPLWPFRKAK